MDGMTLYAIDNLDDAASATREFLTPVDPWTWIKLAVVVFFVGISGSNANPFSFGSPGGPSRTEETPTETTPVPEIGPDVWLLIGAVVGSILLLALAFALVSAIMEFVLIESLRTERVRIRRYWSGRWRQGVRLFGFRIVLGVLGIGVSVLLIGLVALPAILDPGMAGVSIALALVLLPVLLVLAVLVAVIDGFTTAFVVPIMILDDSGVLDGWRRLWPTITDQWKQYLAYAVGVFVLAIAAGIVVSLVVALLAFVLLLPFGLLAAVGVFILTVAEPVGIGLLVLTVVLFALSVLAVAAVAQVPVVAYLRYYALLILGDIEAEFDLIPDLRTTVRE